MGRHGFGRGEYKYFSYPSPDLIGALRTALYPHLALDRQSLERGAWASMCVTRTITQRSSSAVIRPGRPGRRRCCCSTAPGDYNCLHQDLYGEHVFPLQVTILLSEPGRDFAGGEFVLTEQRPRMQSRAEVVPLRRGDAVVFAVHNRPVQWNARGVYRVNFCATASAASARPSSYCRHHFPRCKVDDAKTMDDLFASEPRDLRLTEGAVVLGGFALAYEAPLLAAVRDITAKAPFRHLITPGGYRMSVAVTNCGRLGWVSDRGGYRYDPNPETGLSPARRCPSIRDTCR